jgi:hypothetical protein
MSTPGRRKALAARKRTNKARVQAGKAPLIKDPKTGKMKKTSARAPGIKRGAK